MKFIVYGNGWISNMVKKHLLQSQDHTFVEGRSRVDDTEVLKKELDHVAPTHVMCFIGRTHGVIDGKEYTTIDYLEQPGKLQENIRDNLFSQITLAILCQERGIHLSLIGTGCIFNYDAEHATGFTEEDIPNFFGSSYSIVKGFTDRLLHHYPVCNMRIRMPISAYYDSRNFITKILSYEKICSAPNSMTVLEDFIPIMVELSEMCHQGTINLTNPGVISHNEILEMYKEIVDPDFTWANFSYEEQTKLLANGRSNNMLDTTILQKLFPNILPIKESIRQTLTKMSRLPKLKKV